MALTVGILLPEYGSAVEAMDGRPDAREVRLDAATGYWVGKFGTDNTEQAFGRQRVPLPDGTVGAAAPWDNMGGTGNGVGTIAGGSGSESKNTWLAEVWKLLDAPKDQGPFPAVPVPWKSPLEGWVGRNKWLLIGAAALGAVLLFHRKGRR